MSHGIVVAICITSKAKELMRSVEEVEAIAGRGLRGDRYGEGVGSFQKGDPSKRQVTLMNSRFFKNTVFEFVDARRNIFTRDVELNWLVGKEFAIGEAKFRGVKYCDPCLRPSKISGKSESFAEVFQDCGGIVAEILQGGMIKVGDLVTAAPKGY